MQINKIAHLSESFLRVENQRT